MNLHESQLSMDPEDITMEDIITEAEVIENEDIDTGNTIANSYNHT